MIALDGPEAGSLRFAPSEKQLACGQLVCVHWEDPAIDLDDRQHEDPHQILCQKRSYGVITDITHEIVWVACELFWFDRGNRGRYGETVIPRSLVTRVDHFGEIDLGNWGEAPDSSAD